MTHKILTVLLFLFSGIIMNAQVSLTLQYDENDVSNSVLTLIRDLSMEFDVSNYGATDLNVVIEITEITTPSKSPWWEVCWGECFLPSEPLVLGTITVPAGSTNNEDFHLMYHSDSNNERAFISFHIYDESNFSDFVTLTLDTEHTGVINPEKNSFNIYPNPSNGQFSITCNQNYTNPEFVISDITGKTLYKINSETSVQLFNIENPKSGIYFISMYSNNEFISVKKLIIH